MSGPDDDDLWAPTRPAGVGPSTPPDRPHAGAAHGPEPTQVQPVTGQPAIRLGLGTTAEAGPDGPRQRPPWLLPASIALGVVLIGGLVVALTSGGGDDDANVPAASSSTSTAPGNSIATASSAPTADESGAASTISDAVALTTTTTTAAASTSTDASTSDVSATTDVSDGTTPGTSDPVTVTSQESPTQSTSSATAPPTASTTTPSTVPSTEPSVPTDPSRATPDPGFATYGSEVLAIDAACSAQPLGPDGDDLTTFLVRSASDQRVVIEQRRSGNDVRLDVRYPDDGQTLSADMVAVTDETVAGRVERNGTPIDIVVAAPTGGVSQCFDFIELTPTSDIEGRGYTAGILDVCAVDTPSGRAISGVATDNTSFTIVPIDDIARLTIDVPSLGGTFVDDDALADRDETIVFYEGVVEGAGEPRAAYVEIELAAPRVCAPSESP
ncbi:MAG: hypothetical protein AAGF73_13300 [Actinomycetota bacterium]